MKCCPIEPLLCSNLHNSWLHRAHKNWKFNMVIFTLKQKRRNTQNVWWFIIIKNGFRRVFGVLLALVPPMCVRLFALRFASISWVYRSSYRSSCWFPVFGRVLPETASLGRGVYLMSRRRRRILLVPVAMGAAARERTRCTDRDASASAFIWTRTGSSWSLNRDREVEGEERAL